MGQLSWPSLSAFVFRFAKICACSYEAGITKPESYNIRLSVRLSPNVTPTHQFSSVTASFDGSEA